MSAGSATPLLIEQHYAPNVLRTATVGRRAGGYAIDYVVQIGTLGIGWLIWFAIVAPRGQSPGKQILGLYIMRDDATRAGGGYTWLREYLVKGLLVLGLLGFAFLIVAVIVDLSDFPGSAVPAFYFDSPGLVLIQLGAPGLTGLLLAIDPQRQALWDKIAKTHVAYAPHGHRPQTADELWREQQRTAWEAQQESPRPP